MSRITRLFDYGRTLQQAGRVYGVNSFALAQKALRLKMHYGFMFPEICRNGLLDPQATTERYAQFIGEPELRQLLMQLNPHACRELLFNKARFYEHCQQSNIQAPQLYAIFDRQQAHPALQTPQDWADFIQEKAPEHFIIKPCQGYHGKSIEAYQRQGTEFTRGSQQEKFSAREIVASFYENADFDSFLIQERIFNHPDIQKISGYSGLQTLRILSLQQSNGELLIFPSMIRLIVDDSLVDNVSFGQNPNLTAAVDFETGKLGTTIRQQAHGFGFETLTQHPNSQQTVAGIQLPFWPETLALVKKAAHAFKEARAIGWDVAITEKGPVIIEGNIWFDPPVLGNDPTFFFEALRSECRIE